jgi:curved DNA-binding protein CbpA
MTDTILDKINYYTILGVKETDTIDVIKRAYKKKIRKYHPDRTKDVSKSGKEKYKLIRLVGEVLIDPMKKKAYDFKRNNNNNAFSLETSKKNYEEFIKLQSKEDTEENRKLAKLSFEKGVKELNEQHGYNPEEDDEVLTQEDFANKMTDYELLREQEDIEFTQKDLFKGGEFNNDNFNKMFLASMKKNPAKFNSNSLVRAQELDTYDPYNVDYAPINSSLLYDEGPFEGSHPNYSGFNVSGDDYDSDSDDSIDISGIELEKDEKISVDDMESKMKQFMEERDTELNNDDVFNLEGAHKNLMDNKFNISSQLGFIVGDINGGHDINYELDFTQTKTLEQADNTEDNTEDIARDIMKDNKKDNVEQQQELEDFNNDVKKDDYKSEDYELEKFNGDNLGE